MTDYFPYLERLQIVGTLERNPTALLNGWQKVELAWTQEIVRACVTDNELPRATAALLLRANKVTRSVPPSRVALLVARGSCLTVGFVAHDHIHRTPFPDPG